MFYFSLNRQKLVDSNTDVLKTGFVALVRLDFLRIYAFFSLLDIHFQILKNDLHQIWLVPCIGLLRMYWFTPINTRKAVRSSVAWSHRLIMWVCGIKNMDDNLNIINLIKTYQDLSREVTKIYMFCKMN